ncbi:MAG: sodium:calcium antiporter [Saccharolobus sp.]
MLLFWLEFAGIFLGLMVSAEFLAKGSEELEKKWGQGIVGGILLGFLTALPETIFVIIASITGNFDIALGSAIGGNVLLFTVGLGIVGVAYWLKWRENIIISTEYDIENKFLLISTIAMVLVLFYGKLNIISGTLLISIYAYYLYYRIIKREKVDKSEKISMKKPLVLMTIGGVVLVILSHSFIEYIHVIAEALHVPAIWLSLVISPIAGELEEKISSIRLVQMSKTGGSLSILSFVGSKIENATVLLGIIGFFTDYSLYSALPEYIAAIVANIIALYFLFDKKFGLLESIILFGLYVIIIGLSFIT